MVEGKEVIGAAVASALTLHLVYNRYEPRNIVIQCLFLAIVSLIGISVGLVKYGNESLLNAGIWSTLFHFTLVGVLFTSLAIYRLSLNPLKKFPGPKRAALSKIWLASVVAEGHSPDKIEELHEKYGDIVRIGPNELSIRNVEAVAPILGSQHKLNKGNWFLGSFAAKGQSVHALRDFHAHAARRKYWDRGFSGKALAEYSKTVGEIGDQFIEQLGKASAGEKTMLESGRPHFYIPTVENAMKAISTFSEISWIMPLLTALPAGQDQTKMMDFSYKTTMDRYKRGTAGRPDIFSYLVGEDQAEKAQLTDFELDADVRTVIIAGSDTTASTLTFIFYQLLQHPDWMKKVQDEVEEYRDQELDNDKLTRLPILNAVIQETLRLMPVVPHRSQRLIGKDGLVICDQFIPAGATVSIPYRGLMHDARYFSQPKEWRPQRFITPEKEKAMDKRAYLAFSFGAYNCAGRLLALLELRYYVTMFVLNFDGNLEKGFDTAAFEYGILERFTVQKGALNVNLRPRKRNVAD